MSFSSNVKVELTEHFGNGRHCEIAELAAFVNICGQILPFKDFFCLKIQTENYGAAKKCFTLLQNTFKINGEVSVRLGGRNRRSRSYTIAIKDTEQTKRVLQATGVMRIIDGEMVILNRVYPPVVSSVCCKRAYIRGVFISAGSVTDPEKNYHLEFVLPEEGTAQDLRNVINSFELDSKVVERKEHFIVYLKEGGQIVDLLNIMGAHVALMDLENIRIVKEMRNDINRKVNCETANLNKVVNAAVKQAEDITYIQKAIGLDKLPVQLREVARLRLEYPDISLRELCTYMSEPIGKSGMNHRLRKISNLAQMLREGKGEVK